MVSTCVDLSCCGSLGGWESEIGDSGIGRVPQCRGGGWCCA